MQSEYSDDSTWFDVLSVSRSFSLIAQYIIILLSGKICMKQASYSGNSPFQYFFACIIRINGDESVIIFSSLGQLRRRWTGLR